MENLMKDVNFAYLWAILFLIASIGGMSLYYQDTYGKIADEYKAASQELDQSLALVKEREAELSQRITEANLAKQREAVLSDKYSDLRGEKEALEGELKKTQQELSALKVDYKKLQGDLEITQASLNEAQKTISSLESSVNFLIFQVEAKDSIISSLNEQLASCAQG